MVHSEMAGRCLVRQVMLTLPLKGSKLTSALHSQGKAIFPVKVLRGANSSLPVCSPLPSPSYSPLFFPASVSPRAKTGGRVIDFKKYHLTCSTLGMMLLWLCVSELFLGPKCDVRRLHGFPDFVSFALYPPFPSPMPFLHHVIHPQKIHLPMPRMPLKCSSLSLYKIGFVGRSRI